MNTLLSVKDVCFTQTLEKQWFKKTQSFKLQPVSFDLNRGEILSIIGSNNAGKSTLGHLLVGSKKPDSGEIYLDGQSISQLRQKQRYKDVRMIFQHATEALNPSLTLKSILNQALILNTNLSEKAREEKIFETVAQVGLLPEHVYFYRNMMSVGQRQRAAFARALILDPKVIIADEPFAAMDPSVRSGTVNFILNLCQDRGVAFIIISNNLGIIRHMTDKLIVMHQGNVIESGKTETVFNWPKHPYTQRLLQTYSHMARLDI